MSAAILDHVQGIRKYALRKISIKKDIFIFECFWRHPEELKCAGCRSGNVRRKGTKMRIFTGVYESGPGGSSEFCTHLRPISYHADAASDDHGLSTHDLSQIAGRNRPPSH